MIVYFWAGFLGWLGQSCLLAGREATLPGYRVFYHLVSITSLMGLLLLLKGLL